MAEKKSEKSFIWRGLRISFWVMVGLWVVSIILGIAKSSLSTSAVGIILGIIFFISIIFTFVVSIIHLIKYKQKGFAITALVISSVSILFELLSMIIALLIGLNGATA